MLACILIVAIIGKMVKGHTEGNDIIATILDL